MEMNTENEYTWCGYEVPEIISLREIQGATRLDRSKYTSVHVSICVSSNFNTLL